MLISCATLASAWVVLLVCLSGQAAVGHELQYPLAVVADQAGTVYVADRNLPGIWQIQEGQAQIYFQAKATFRTPLNAVRCLVLDREGHLLAGDSATREVYRFDDQRQPVPLSAGSIGIPMAIAVNQSGEIFVADLESHAIYQLPAAGGKPVLFVSVPAPRGLAIDKQDHLWVVSHGTVPVLRIAPDKSVEQIVTQPIFQFAHQIAVDNAGGGYVTDGYGQCVWKLTPGQEPQKILSGPPLKNPVGICLSNQQLLIADSHQRMIYTWDSNARAIDLLLKP
jgi:sugar lactone lactonase YvrE